MRHPQALDLLLEVHPVLRVETCRRLVQEQQCRSVHHAERDVESTPLPTGQRTDDPRPHALQVHRGEQLVAAFARSAASEAVTPPLHHEFVPHPLGVAGAVPLTDVPDGAAHRCRLRTDVVTSHGGRTGSGLQQRREHAQRGGLPGSVRAEEGEEFARMDGQVDATHRLHRPVFRGEMPRQPVGPDHGVVLRRVVHAQCRWWVMEAT